MGTKSKWKDPMAQTPCGRYAKVTGREWYAKPRSAGRAEDKMRKVDAASECNLGSGLGWTLCLVLALGACAENLDAPTAATSAEALVSAGGSEFGAGTPPSALLEGLQGQTPGGELADPGEHAGEGATGPGDVRPGDPGGPDLGAPPIIRGSSLPGDVVLDVIEVDGVRAVRGFNPQVGLHFLDVGGSPADYGLETPAVAERPVLRDAEWVDGRLEGRFASERGQGTVLVGPEGVQWVWEDDQRAGTLRYGAAVEAYLELPGGHQVRLGALRQSGQVGSGGATFHGRIHEGAYDRFVLDRSQLRYEHVIEERPGEALEAYVVVDEVEVEAGWELVHHGGAISVGETVSGDTEFHVAPVQGTSTVRLGFPRPVAFDATGESAVDWTQPREERSFVSYRVTRLDATRYRFETRLAGSWLMDEDRVFPVVLDPTARWVDVLGSGFPVPLAFTEPFNMCASRTRTQYYISPMLLGSAWDQGTVVTALSFYQIASNSDNWDWDRVRMPHSYVYMSNAGPVSGVDASQMPPPVTGGQEPPNQNESEDNSEGVTVVLGPNWFSNARGFLLWSGTSGVDTGTTSGFWGTYINIRPSWWGEWRDSTIFRAPGTSMGDFPYQGGSWIRVTAGHERGWFLSGSLWAQITGGGCDYTLFQFVSCPTGLDGQPAPCEIYGNERNGQVGSFGSLPTGFGYQFFPRTRLWYSEVLDLNYPGYYVGPIEVVARTAGSLTVRWSFAAPAESYRARFGESGYPITLEGEVGNLLVLQGADFTVSSWLDDYTAVLTPSNPLSDYSAVPLGVYNPSVSYLLDNSWQATLYPTRPIPFPVQSSVPVDPNLQMETNVHTYRYEVKQTGIVDLIFENIDNAEDLRVWVMNDNGLRHCVTNPTLACPERRIYRTVPHTGELEMSGGSNSTAASAPLDSATCGPDELMTGVRHKESWHCYGFLCISSRTGTYTRYVEPVCSRLYPQFSAPNDVRVVQSRIVLGVGRSSSAAMTETKCDAGDVVRSLRVRSSAEGVRNFRIRCAPVSYDPTSATFFVSTAGAYDRYSYFTSSSGFGGWINSFFGTWQGEMVCPGATSYALNGIRARTRDHVRRMGPLCGLLANQPVSGAGWQPDFSGAGRYRLGTLTAGTILNIKVDVPGRAKLATYGFEPRVLVEPNQGPLVSVLPRRPPTNNPVGALLAVWEPLPGSAIYAYQYQRTGQCEALGLVPPCDEVWQDTCQSGSVQNPPGTTNGCTNGTAPANLRNLYQNLLVNQCYSVWVRGVAEAGFSPIGESASATLIPRPVASDIQTLMINADGGLVLQWIDGTIPLIDAPEECAGTTNRSRYWARVRPCTQQPVYDDDGILDETSLGVVAQTEPGANERTIVFPDGVIGGPGCYDIDIRYFNRVDRFRSDLETDAQATLTIRRWLGVDGNMYDLRGQGLSSSVIGWTWRALVGASGYQYNSQGGGWIDHATSFFDQTGLPANTCRQMVVRAYAENPNGTRSFAETSNVAIAATLVPVADPLDIRRVRTTTGRLELEFDTGRLSSVKNMVPGTSCPTFGATPTAFLVQAKRCTSTEWQDPQTGNQWTTTSNLHWVGLQGPGCYDFQIAYRNRSGNTNAPTTLRMWVDVNVHDPQDPLRTPGHCGATNNLSSGINIRWNQIPDVTYRIVRQGGSYIVADNIVAGSFLQTPAQFNAQELAMYLPGAPQNVRHTPLAGGRDRVIEWDDGPESAGNPDGGEPILHYVVQALDFDGNVLASGVCGGRLTPVPILGYRVEYDDGVAMPVPNIDVGNFRNWTHLNVPGPDIGIGPGHTASQGTFEGYVALDGTGVALTNGGPRTTNYRAFAYNTYGVGTGSSWHAATRTLSPTNTFQWQRAYPADTGEWVNVSGAGLLVNDFGAPANGDPAGYRIRRTNAGTDQIAFTAPRILGWVKPPPGPFTVISSPFNPVDRSLTFSWDPGSAGAQSYFIQRSGLGGGSWISIGSNQQHTFTNLLPNQCYTVTVQATNGAPPDAFASAQNATGFVLPPDPQHVEFAGLSGDDLVLRLSRSYIPGWDDLGTCQPNAAMPPVQNLTSVYLIAQACDGTGLPFEVTQGISDGLEFNLPFGTSSCLVVSAVYYNRLGFSSFTPRVIGEFRRPPTGTPDVFVTFSPLATFGFDGESFGLEYMWNPISGAGGYFFKLVGPHGEGPRITTRNAEPEFDARYLQENTCYTGEATAFNFDGGILQTGNTGTARMATMIRNPVFRSSIDETDPTLNNYTITGSADGMTCKPDESWDLVLREDEEGFFVRVFNRPPNFGTTNTCQLGTNQTAMRYQVRKCEVLPGNEETFPVSSWNANPLSAFIPFGSHHCYEVRVQYRNMDGVASQWSHPVNGDWPRIRVIALEPPSGLVQIDAGINTITWQWVDETRREDGFQLRRESWSRDPMAANRHTSLCVAVSTTRATTGTEYQCVQTANFYQNTADDVEKGNRRGDVYVRAMIGDPLNPTGSGFEAIYGPSTDMARGFTLTRPPVICGTAERNCGGDVNWLNSEDLLLTAVDCNEARTSCFIRGAIGAPLRSRTQMTGARLTRQRIDVAGQPVVPITENQCLDGTCANNAASLNSRGYGVVNLFDSGYFEGRDDGEWQDSNLVYGATYRYTMVYYNGTGFVSEATSFDVTIGCTFGTGLGVCGQGLPGTIDIVVGGTNLPIVGGCTYPGYDGEERCDDIDWSCSGDPYTDELGNYVFNPGAICGTCGLSTTACLPDGSGEFCQDPDAGVNDCGGCNALNASVGEPCYEPLGCEGEYICDPDVDPATNPNGTRVLCGNLLEPINACGQNCLALDADPGDTCGPLDSNGDVCPASAYICNAFGLTECENAIDAGLNACRFCTNIEPGDVCEADPDALGVCQWGVWQCGPTDMFCQPNQAGSETCNYQDDDCDGEVDNGAREVDVEVTRVFDGTQFVQAASCDITVGTHLCTAVDFTVYNYGTDIIPADAVVDIIAVNSAGVETVLVGGATMGRAIAAGGSGPAQDSFRLCWDNAERLHDVTLRVVVSDRDSAFTCLDEDLSWGEFSTTVRLAACGPEICDGYNSTQGGLRWPVSLEPQTVCSAGQVCTVDRQTALGNDVIRCTADSDCLTGAVCNVHQERCVACRGQAVGDEDCRYGGCPHGSVCLDTGVCVEGCFRDNDCAAGQLCVQGACVQGQSQGPGSDERSSRR